MAVAIQFGQICKHCTPGSCRDKPSKLEPAIVKCTSCDGDGCDTCNGRGTVEICDCPHALIDRSTWRAIRAAEFANKGLLPIEGGTLNQSQSFMEACEAIWNEQAWWRAKLQIVQT